MLRFSLSLIFAPLALVAQVTVRQEPSGLVSATGQPTNLADRTLFGIPYGTPPAVLLLEPTATASSKDPRASTGIAKQTTQTFPPLIAPVAPVAAKSESVPASKGAPLQIDYGIALKAAPIEMILPGAVMIDGHRFLPGQSFSFNLPLSRFTGVVKQQTTVRAGSVHANRVVENPDDLVQVPCVFLVKSVRAGVLNVQVIPDPRFPAREQYLAITTQ